MATLVVGVIVLVGVIGLDRWQGDQAGPTLGGADIKRGAALFQLYCVSCHGKQAEGAPNWFRRDSSGNFPPPPLNGDGHAWHHPKAYLANQIRNGSKLMPPFGKLINDQEIEAIITWFQSLWPRDLYHEWQSAQSEYGQKK